MEVIQEEAKCPVCNFRIKNWGQSGKFTIMVCSKCGLGITKYSNIQSSDYHRDTVYLQSIEQFRNIFERRSNIIKSYHPTPGRILEIGSSTGLMLSLFKQRGWEVMGVEMSQQAANYAQAHGIPTIKEKIEEVKLLAESFDVVIINHTLEHLNDPNAVLEKIYLLLKDKGIVLIDVPNFGSFSASILKNRWPSLLPEEHLWHFTFMALSKILKNHHFNVQSVSYPSGIWDYGSPLKEVWQSFIGFKKRFFINVFTAVPSLIISFLNQGTTLTVLAQKIKK